MTTTNTESRHKNEVSKMAAGHQNWEIVLITERATPQEALELVEWLMIKAVKGRKWRDISPTKKEQAEPFYRDKNRYFMYWRIAASQVFTNPQESEHSRLIAERLLLIMEKMAQADSSKEFSNDQCDFDADALSIMTDVLMENLLKCIPESGGSMIWHKLLIFTEILSGTLSDVFTECLERAFPTYCKHADKALWLLSEIEKSGAKISEKTFAGKAPRILWKSLGILRDRELIEWSQLIAPLIGVGQKITITDSTAKVIACRNAVKKICHFSNAVTDLPAYIKSLNLPLAGAPEIRAVTEACILEEVIVHINSDHFDFSDTSLKKQRGCASQLRLKLLASMGEWADKNGIRGFKVTIKGRLREKLKHENPRPEEVFVNETFTIR